MSDPDLSYEQELREECEALSLHNDVLIGFLDVVETYLENREDITGNGGPNEEMRLLTELRAAREGRRLP
jgi:hypothetical protein